MSFLQNEKEFFFDEEQTKYFCKLLAERYNIKFHDLTMNTGSKKVKEIEFTSGNNIHEFIEKKCVNYNFISVLALVADRKDEDDRCYVSINNDNDFKSNLKVCIIAPYNYDNLKTYCDVNHTADNMDFLKNIDFFHNY